jgi:hypothetical protein
MRRHWVAQMVGLDTELNVALHSVQPLEKCEDGGAHA